jgi:hypothetical protein
MAKYLYSGPVMVFGKLVGNWRGETIADNEAKAKSNLAYQFRKQNNRAANTVVEFPNKLKIIR